MSSSPNPLDMTRRQVFGSVAEIYDAARPGYPDVLVSAVLDYAALGDRPALEAGAGTGKATVPFAAALNGPLTCIEPDARMAEILRRKTAAHPNVRIEVSSFEDWQPGDTRFGLLFAATSWHWIDPGRRWDLAHDVLAPGGTVALFWNPLGIRDPDLHAALSEVDQRHGLTHTPHAVLASAFGDTPGHWPDMLGHWPAVDCAEDARFTDLRSLRFREEAHYETADYLAYLSSLSMYAALPTDHRTQALTDTATVLNTHGTGAPVERIHDLFLTRRH
ncbi:class I SAM-dependent methyltransferase [Kitasatospora purpeofusca]|uniref:class I SAM-dependent methyltransferase n=1 Tax=Kitasatospora purpeofusca TaxID=67352 RepID=UPI002256F452|nr:class I SAM-dependent methyltransferase [Kitasatospora purpeofusca]MCX4752051.1 class I SAM-dependent methyltransferase [Kitasatospora purpeofusca]MCX4757858.1 class I SAM-dependent methyltransferase [Kitasatospora purpeofusca]WSR31654.1 class I SAM-dependent methyltransferase [Kitasatospora purpeofusca]WSR39681.1 class I SAM-dependent methyltransferase [Kitasatospora purpeofusca]